MIPYPESRIQHPVSRIPVDLLWFSALGLFWLWAVPETLLQAPSGVLAGAGLLLVILGAEALQIVLQADLQGGFEHLATRLRVDARAILHAPQGARETLSPHLPLLLFPPFADCPALLNSKS